MTKQSNSRKVSSWNAIFEKIIIVVYSITLDESLTASHKRNLGFSVGKRNLGFHHWFEGKLLLANHCQMPLHSKSSWLVFRLSYMKQENEKQLSRISTKSAKLSLTSSITLNDYIRKCRIRKDFCRWFGSKRAYGHSCDQLGDTSLCETMFDGNSLCGSYVFRWVCRGPVICSYNSSCVGRKTNRPYSFAH